MTEGPLIIEVPDPVAWPDTPGAGLVWPEPEQPAPIVQSDAAEVLPPDFASETVLTPQLIETVVLPVSAERGPAGPQQIFAQDDEPTGPFAYPVLWFDTDAYGAGGPAQMKIWRP